MAEDEKPEFARSARFIRDYWDLGVIYAFAAATHLYPVPMAEMIVDAAVDVTELVESADDIIHGKGETHRFTYNVEMPGAFETGVPDAIEMEELGS
jgi:hypothetical protein